MAIDYDALGEAVRRRDHCVKSVARWTEALAEAEANIAAITAGIAQAAAGAPVATPIIATSTNTATSGSAATFTHEEN